MPTTRLSRPGLVGLLCELILALALALPIDASAAEVGPIELLKVAGIDPGPHAVGFASLRLRDTSRPWPSSTDPSGTRGRPVQVSVWYPAAGPGGAPLDVEDYVVADWTGAAPVLASESVRADALAAARRSFDAGRTSPLSEAAWRRVLSARSGASLGAPLLPGRHPLVLFETGLGGRSFWNLPLVEALAGHGYVVACLASYGKSETERLGFDLDGVQAQVEDMERALKALAARPDVDVSRLGLVAWSAGGVSQALLRLRHPGRFRAAVSLDSGTGYAYGAALLAAAGGVEADALLTPFLHFDAGWSDVPVQRDGRFFREHGRAPALCLELTGLRHRDLVLSQGAGRAIALGDEADPEALVGLGGMAEHVRLFLDAHLRGDAASWRQMLRRLEERRPDGVRLSERRERLSIASDGWKLVSDLVIPGGESDVPAVLMLNKAAGTRAAYAPLAERLARQGLASLRLDLRAHGDSTNHKLE